MSLTDAQIDIIWSATVKAEGCQWLGNQDHICGGKPVAGKWYCTEHYDRMYVKGSALAGKRKAKQLEKELREAELAKLVEEQENDDIDDIKEDIYVG
jgi:hypothetical protein